MAENGNDPYIAPALRRGLRALELIAASDKPMSLSELSRRLDVNRSSAFRLLHTLREMRYVEAGPKGEIVPAPRLLTLSNEYLSSRPVVELARKYLVKLRDKTGLISHLSMLDGRNVVCIDVRRGRESDPLPVRTGATWPAHASSSGWMLLAEHDRDDLEARFGDGPLPRTEGGAPADLDVLFEMTATARRDGVATSYGSLLPHGFGASAAIRDGTGGIVAAIGVSGEDAGIDLPAVKRRFARTVRSAASSVSAKLGYLG